MVYRNRFVISYDNSINYTVMDSILFPGYLLYLFFISVLSDSRFIILPFQDNLIYYIYFGVITVLWLEPLSGSLSVLSLDKYYLAVIFLQPLNVVRKWF